MSDMTTTGAFAAYKAMSATATGGGKAGGAAADAKAGKDCPIDEKAMRTAHEFESLLLSKLTSIMFSGVKSDGLFGGGPGAEIYKNMLSEQYGKVLASSGGIGLADSIYREIIKTQEVA